MSSVKIREACLIYNGSSNFRMRLLLSILSGRPVKIENIRSLHDNPGLREFEVNLIRLLDKVTNGTIVELNQTGTRLYFQPGLLIGGEISHECCKLRAISYYLEVLILLAPFCKKPLNCTLMGVTNANNEISVDSIASGLIPILQKFLVVNDGLSLKILKRGMAPEGGGQIQFTCPARKSLKPVQICVLPWGRDWKIGRAYILYMLYMLPICIYNCRLLVGAVLLSLPTRRPLLDYYDNFLDMGKVKRIRGVAFAARVSPAFANRMVETAKRVLLNFIPDVYINTDCYKGDKAGKSPGFGISLTAETTTGVFLTCDRQNVIPEPGVEPSVPEDLGREAANLLLEEIYRGGCVSSSFQSCAALWMTLTQKDVSKFMTGPLSPYTINFLCHIQDFFGLTFKLDTKVNEDEDTDIADGTTKVFLTCLGIGYSNISKRTL